MPYEAGETPMEKIRQWSYDTFQQLFSLLAAGNASECGLRVVGGTKVCVDKLEVLDWANDVFGFRCVAFVPTPWLSGATPAPSAITDSL